MLSQLQLVRKGEFPTSNACGGIVREHGLRRIKGARIRHPPSQKKADKTKQVSLRATKPKGFTPGRQTTARHLAF
jgi:hypothetical protein